MDFQINHRPHWSKIGDEDYGRGYSIPVAGMKERVLNGSDVMFKTKRPVTFVYTYPLSFVVKFAHSRKHGKWTRTDVCRQIQIDYERIYREEDKAAPNVGNIPGMLNRARSAGPHGIWGHVIDDLVIERVTYNPKTRIIELSIGS